MNTIRTTLSAVTAAAVLVIASTVAVSAADELNDRVEAEQTQEASAKCSASGQYGADVDCKVKVKQSQKLIVYAPRVKVLGKTHTPVNTALDATATTAVFVSGILGLAAFAGYLKLSK